MRPVTRNSFLGEGNGFTIKSFIFHVIINALENTEISIDTLFLPYCSLKVPLVMISRWSL